MSRWTLLVMAMCVGGVAAASDEATCPAKQQDPCRVEQDAVCNVDRNPPPWATPESQAKKRQKLERELAACRERHKGDPADGGAAPSPLPPWRKN